MIHGKEFDGIRNILIHFGYNQTKFEDKKYNSKSDTKENIIKKTKFTETETDKTKFNNCFIHVFIKVLLYMPVDSKKGFNFAK